MCRDTSKWLSQGIMIGDKNAVEALQNAHLRQLLSCGALTVQKSPAPWGRFQREQVFWDVYVDDLGSAGNGRDIQPCLC